MDYDKPHLSFEQQIEHLRAKGLAIADPGRAASVLVRVGYYRLSAYAYPFRRLLEPDEFRSTAVQYRDDTFLPGASFDLVVSLWEFDRDLRLLLMDALEAIEIGLRVQVSYVLGRRDPFGHLNIASLDAVACARQDSAGANLWRTWIDRHLRAQQDAVSEDFVRHHIEKYDGDLPIWVSTEIMEVGALVRLYGFMRDDDRAEIARTLGTSSGSVMHKWMKSVNYVRNLVAHHARVWNRKLTYSIAKPGTQAPSRILHLRELDNGHRSKIYATAAIMAHIVRSLDPDTDWPRRFADLAARFPSNEFVSPAHDMGFPANWTDNELWS